MDKLKTLLKYVLFTIEFGADFTTDGNLKPHILNFRVWMALLIALAVGLFVAQPASAQPSDTYVPLQAQHAGLWLDPGQPERGVYVAAHPDGRTATVIYFGGRVLDHELAPAWFIGDFRFSGPRRTSPLQVSRAVLGEVELAPSDGLLTGEFVLSVPADATTCDRLVAEVWLVAGTDNVEVGETLDMIRLLPAPPGECRTCRRVTVGPFVPGCVPVK